MIIIVSDKRFREKLTRQLADEKLRARVVLDEEIVALLDEMVAGPAPAPSTVRGYTVKVIRQSLAPADLARRCSAVAGVIARSLGKS